VSSVLTEGLAFLSQEKVEVTTTLCEVESALSSDYKRNGANCTEFIKPNGEPGKLGKVIVNHIQALGDQSQYYRDDLVNITTVCPKWKSLSKEHKTYFWLWMFAAISWKETTCGAHKENPAGTHGVAVGHLQLNKNRRDRSWRGGESGKSCAVNDIANDENNLRCGIEIMNELLKGRNGLYKGSGEIYGRRANSYWQGLRSRHGGNIIRFVKGYPFCK
jgi:hypothetical protein